MKSAKRFFDFHAYDEIAKRDDDDFADMGTVVSQGYGEGSTYTFRDNGSNVLGVAHLDTVQSSAYASLLTVNKEPVLLSPRVDDRLGVYIITRLLPAMGVTCDWLLTTGEEIGQSSAELFRASKVYNWAFSFDRAGTDVVLYQHDHKALRRVLRKAGFRVGQGMFSDLSFLDVGCSGINFGCGYDDAHGIHAHAFLNDTFAMLDLFVRFFRRWQNARLPYKPSAPYQRWESWRHQSWRPYVDYEAAWAAESAESFPDWEPHGNQYLSKYNRWLEAQERLEWQIEQNEALEALANGACDQ